MHTNKLLALLLTVLVCASATGCAYLGKDRRDAPWDPPRGRQLMEQIPNNDNATARCCGRDISKCQSWQTPRC